MTSIFDASLLVRPVALPEDLDIRPLKADDHKCGYLDILFPLAPAQEPLTAETFNKQFAAMSSQTPRSYFIIVITLEGKVIASSSLLLEMKFLRNGRTAGHIEDVVVSPAHQGRKLGKIMIDTLTQLAGKLGCYKVILDCAEENVGFYEKCGYKRVGAEMKIYLN